MSRGAGLRSVLGDYLRKLRGQTHGSPPRVSRDEVLWSWVGAFIGIGAVGWFNQQFFAGSDLTLTIGSLGASAVLLTAPHGVRWLRGCEKSP